MLGVGTTRRLYMIIDESPFTPDRMSRPIKLKQREEINKFEIERAISKSTELEFELAMCNFFNKKKLTHN